MAKFWKDILWPGTHSTSVGTRTWTVGDIRSAYETSRQMLKEGITPPLVYEHPPAKSAEFEPMSRADLEAARAKNTAGWAVGSRIRDGVLQFMFDVPDDEDAKRIKQTNHRFVSPGQRKLWRDKFKDAILHVAITNKPHNWKQGPFEPVLMSEADDTDEVLISYEDTQMAETTPTPEEQNAKPEAPENPDLPKRNPDQQKLQAVLVLLKECFGVDLPADTDMDSMLDALLTGLKTAKATKDLEESKKSKDDDDDQYEVQDPEGMTMSEQDRSALDSMREKLATQHRTNIGNTLNSLSGRVPKALIDKLSARVDTVQMSDSGDEEPMLLMSEVVELLDEAFTENITGRKTGKTAASKATVEDHPEGDAFLMGEDADLSDDAVEKMNADLCGEKRSGYLHEEMWKGPLTERSGGVQAPAAM